MNPSPSIFVKAIVVLALAGIIAFPGAAEESSALLQTPGSRLLEDPSTVIPTVHEYVNQNFALPKYREHLGKPGEGWAVEIIKTRRFAGNQSARLYFRKLDLARSTVFREPNIPWDMRIWPRNTIVILEAYDRDGSTLSEAKPVEIAAMAKIGKQGKGSSSTFFPVDWSYAIFTPEGAFSLLPDEVEECHRCHSTAFHLNGDLIFTQFNKK